VSCGPIDDTQPPHAEHGVIIGVETVVVRATM